MLEGPDLIALPVPQVFYAPQLIVVMKRRTQLDHLIVLLYIPNHAFYVNGNIRIHGIHLGTQLLQRIGRNYVQTLIHKVIVKVVIAQQNFFQEFHRPPVFERCIVFRPGYGNFLMGNLAVHNLPGVTVGQMADALTQAVSIEAGDQRMGAYPPAPGIHPQSRPGRNKTQSVFRQPGLWVVYSGGIIPLPVQMGDAGTHLLCCRV